MRTFDDVISSVKEIIEKNPAPAHGPCPECGGEYDKNWAMEHPACSTLYLERLERERDEDQRRQQAEYRAQRLERMAVNCFGGAVDFRGKTFESFIVTAENKPSFERARNWAADKGIYFFGPTGCGKTHLLCAIAQEAIPGNLEDSPSLYFDPVRFVKLGRFFSDLYACPFEDKPRMVSSLERSKVLLIDDFGLEKNSEFTESTLERIFDYRYEHRLLTFVSSNFPGEKLKEMFSPRIVSRLFGLVDFVRLNGKDRRIAK